MTDQAGTTGLQLRSMLKPEGRLELSLVVTPKPEPQAEEVLVEVQAAPLNPSDLGLLLAGVDPATLQPAGGVATPVVTAPVAPAVMQALKARVGQPLPVGNEGAGVVVAAGSSPAAQALLGKTVSMIGGGMYAEYRCLHVSQCQPLPPGTSAADGASWFINPMTVLGMLETMRTEGHSALVHTAAASNLGQMLQRLCLADGVPLVNVVRKPEQAALLRDLGAHHVCDTSAATFESDLLAALRATSATVVFDAIGGGDLASRILNAMEAVAGESSGTYSLYGTTTHKQAYVYGMLDPSPTVIHRHFGFTWGVAGWLLPSFLQRAGGETAQRLRGRVAAELKTTFASKYSREISLREALRPDVIAAYARQATGEKFLIVPRKS